MQQEIAPPARCLGVGPKEIGCFRRGTALLRAAHAMLEDSCSLSLDTDNDKGLGVFF